MIAHVVLIKLEDKSKASELKAALDSLPADIPEIKKFEIGINEIDSTRSFHLAIYSHFESYETLKIYIEHPAHRAVTKVIDENTQIIHSVDYTL